MSDYTVTTDFAEKDTLATGNAAKVVKGAEHSAEYNNIATAVNSKADANNGVHTGTATFENIGMTGALTGATIDGGTY